MKAYQTSQAANGNGHIMSGTRQRSPSKRPLWIIILLSLVCLSLIGSYVYPPKGFSACYLFNSNVCSPFLEWLPPVPTRDLTDEELRSHVVFKEILSVEPIKKNSSKIAFMFLTPGSLPFEKLWEKFFKGHEDLYTIYVHTSKEKPVYSTSLFSNKDITNDKKIAWGKMSMVGAERRLLAYALQEADNQYFILLSESCVPLRDFDYVYTHLMGTNISFVDRFEDPGPHGSGRYSELMLPEVEMKDFQKGSQWFSLKRQHALVILADSLYYNKFKNFCRPGMDGKNCYAEEHYFPTLLHMVDPSGISNWSLTHVDWSEAKWHPKIYRARDVTVELLKKINSKDESIHVTSDEEKIATNQPCMWNGRRKPCYLFARKFYPEALIPLMRLFPNYTAI